MKRFTVKSITTSFLLYVMILLTNQAAFSQLTCQLSGAPIVQTGSLTVSDPTQNGRTNRNGIVGSCPTGKMNNLFASTVLHQDNYTFTNPTGQNACVTVDFDASGCGGNTTQMVAYSTFDPANPGNNIISDFGFSSTAQASFGFPIAAGASYTLVVHEITANSGCPSYTFTVRYRTSCQQPGFDRANDGLADLAVFRPGALGFWANATAAGGSIETRQFGQTGDIPTAGDYTGDGQTDLSVYRPSNNTWYYATNQANPPSQFVGVPWGVASDKPVPGDYDGDGKNDIAIWRPSNAHYYVLRSSNNTLFTRQWGRMGDTPVAADVDGDLITDFTVVRPDQAGESQLVWFMLQSNFNYGFGLFTRWGVPGDIPVPADYDGNGKADIAIFRPTTGQWAALPSVAQNAVGGAASIGIQWGTSGDIPQPADYDGDLIADQAVFRPSNNTWYIRNSSSNTATITPFGATGDTPATAPYPITTVP